MATRERIHTVARLNETYERILLPELKTREDEIDDIAQEIKQLRKRSAELEKEANRIEEAHRTHELALNFIASYSTLVPAGCPDPWGTALRDWGTAAESSLPYPPGLTGGERA